MFAKLIIALTPMVLALPLAMDIYVPAIPHLTKEFHASDTQMLMTLNLFMLSAGLMQLVIGPISDHFGRRRISVLMAFCFALGSLCCGLATNVNELVAYRIIQALGSCGMMVLGFAIVRDHYAGDKSAKAYSFLNGMISFSPIFATFIGSYLDLYLGWPSTFWALLLVAFPAIVTVGCWLDESLPANRRTALTTQVLAQYLHVVRNQEFAIYTLASAFGHCYFYLFCALSPYLIIRTLEIPQTQYGFYFCFMGISLLIGSFIGGSIVERLGIFKTCLLGYLLSLIGGLWMLIWYLAQGLSIHNFIYPMLFIGIGGTFCMGAGSGGAMAPFEEAKGAAAAAGGALRFLFAGIVGYFLISKTVSSTLPLAIPAVLFSLIGISVLLLVYKESERTIVNID
ncbi:multidrug effflux MFS transporter [Legionella micdadei]|uniref:Bcr/CflA family efflux transporter n=1 Tax=Legionella micdadei TaxID=451 RepID=A0A098GIF8_LEGMI|nr:multidrug effflux MFS transporter [Legionella micdadei]ARG96831.1 Bcr/CflA family drug resistance efflux transporter [Legionella micdadei]ARG99564.1 Bcr/CflA family drug resistance efflux transporter [Legionella micdadei]KTD26509.1 florfenicol efflux pump [Legionella micdadei]NSL17901.1 multidrug effflux MFS transporter [Legionella micdadei]CEG61772.1 Multidrug resistance transporter, Bcr family [Legionella micdadei]